MFPSPTASKVVRSAGVTRAEITTRLSSGMVVGGSLIAARDDSRETFTLSKARRIKWISRERQN